VNWIIQIDIGLFASHAEIKLAHCRHSYSTWLEYRTKEISKKTFFFMVCKYVNRPIPNEANMYMIVLLLLQVCHYKSFVHCFHDDLLLGFWRTSLLAYTSLLLGCTLCSYNEAPDPTYDQVQVCAFQLRQAGEHSFPLSYWFSIFTRVTNNWEPVCNSFLVLFPNNQDTDSWYKLLVNYLIGIYHI
jgi:hypothetical protein